jgi:hypothetical protein
MDNRTMPNRATRQGRARRRAGELRREAWLPVQPGLDLPGGDHVLLRGGQQHRAGRPEAGRPERRCSSRPTGSWPTRTPRAAGSIASRLGGQPVPWVSAMAQGHGHQRPDPGERDPARRAATRGRSRRRGRRSIATGHSAASGRGSGWVRSATSSTRSTWRRTRGTR